MDSDSYYLFVDNEESRSDGTKNRLFGNDEAGGDYRNDSLNLSSSNLENSLSSFRKRRIKVQGISNQENKAVLRRDDLVGNIVLVAHLLLVIVALVVHIYGLGICLFLVLVRNKNNIELSLVNIWIVEKIPLVSATCFFLIFGVPLWAREKYSNGSTTVLTTILVITASVECIICIKLDKAGESRQLFFFSFMVMIIACACSALVLSREVMFLTRSIVCKKPELEIASEKEMSRQPINESKHITV